MFILLTYCCMNHVPRALITWASSWIGKELATIHAEKWWNLVLVARRKEKLESLQKTLESTYQVDVHVVVKDLSEPHAAQEIYDELHHAWVTIDYLINNAWFWWQWVFHERDWIEDRNMIQVNVMALCELTRLFLPDFVAKDSGKILQVSSTASYFPGPLQAVYFATKAFVQSFSNAIAYELHNTNITVTNLMPWATATEFAKTWWLEKTKLFNSNAMVTARSVAEEWYAWMMKGKLDVISWLNFMQKLMLWFIPFVPKKVLLQQVYNLQVSKS